MLTSCIKFKNEQIFFLIMLIKSNVNHNKLINDACNIAQ